MFDASTIYLSKYVYKLLYLNRYFVYMIANATESIKWLLQWHWSNPEGYWSAKSRWMCDASTIYLWQYVYELLYFNRYFVYMIVRCTYVYMWFISPYLQASFNATESIKWLLQWHWSNPEGYWSAESTVACKKTSKRANWMLDSWPGILGMRCI